MLYKWHWMDFHISMKQMMSIFTLHQNNTSSPCHACPLLQKWMFSQGNFEYVNPSYSDFHSFAYFHLHMEKIQIQIMSDESFFAFYPVFKWLWENASSDIFMESVNICKWKMIRASSTFVGVYSITLHLTESQNTMDIGIWTSYRCQQYQQVNQSGE